MMDNDDFMKQLNADHSENEQPFRVPEMDEMTEAELDDLYVSSYHTMLFGERFEIAWDKGE